MSNLQLANITTEHSGAIATLEKVHMIITRDSKHVFSITLVDSNNEIINDLGTTKMPIGGTITLTPLTVLCERLPEV